jgi:hypothetical protein
LCWGDDDWGETDVPEVRAVAVDDDVIAIGADRRDEGASTTGAVYLFERGGGAPSFAEKILPADISSDFQFGSALALVGKTLVVGAYGESSAGAYTGAAYIFEQGASSWTETAKLVAPGGSAGASFGRAVALDGDRAVVGAPGAAGPSGSTGLAYVFERTGTSWTSTAELAPDPGEDGERFGWAVAVAGETILVGAPGAANGAGAAYVFTWVGSAWTGVQISSTQDHEELGTSVALESLLALIGGPSQAHLATTPPYQCLFPCVPGTVHVLEHDGTSWVESAALQAVDGKASDQFGYTLDLFESTAAVTSFTRESGSGAAYAIELGPQVPPVLSNGETCTSNAECASAHCVDAVCCDTVCSGQCEACDVATSVGTCSAVSGVPHGSRSGCEIAEPDSPCRARLCDGAARTSCAGYVAEDVACGEEACAGNDLVAGGSCDGQGECAAPLPASCAPYACKAGACVVQCRSNAECASGAACSGGACVIAATIDEEDTSESCACSVPSARGFRGGLIVAGIAILMALLRRELRTRTARRSRACPTAHGDRRDVERHLHVWPSGS